MKLHATGPGIAPQTWEVSDAPVQIGRVDCAIRLADRTVSRRHARLSYADGAFILEDLNSTGGTFINERQISGPTPVRDGDRLGFGDVVLLAEVRTPAVPVAASPFSAVAGATMLFAEPSAAVAIASRSESQVSLVDPTLSEVPPSWPTTYTPVPVVAPATPRPPGEASRLGTAALDFDHLASSLRRLQRETDAVLATFDQYGGARAVQSLLQYVRGAPETAGLRERLPAIVRFLELELALVGALRTEEPDGRG